jgi:hypothetical protein
LFLAVWFPLQSVPMLQLTLVSFVVRCSSLVELCLIFSPGCRLIIFCWTQSYFNVGLLMTSGTLVALCPVTQFVICFTVHGFTPFRAPHWAPLHCYRPFLLLLPGTELPSGKFWPSQRPLSTSLDPRRRLSSFDLHLADVLCDVILPSVLGSSLWSFG